MSYDAANLPPLVQSGVQLHIQEVAFDIPDPPDPPPLNGTHSSALQHSDLAIEFTEEAPDDSVLSGLGDQLRELGGDDISLGGQTIGIKDFKTNFIAAMKKDGDWLSDSYVKSKPLRFLKKSCPRYRVSSWNHNKSHRKSCGFCCRRSSGSCRHGRNVCGCDIFRK